MLAILLSLFIFSWIILRWSFFFHQRIPSLAIIAVFILKSIAGYFSFQYHSIYFAGGDGAIYIQGGQDLINYSGGSLLKFISLFLNLNRGASEWELIYQKIIYWDSNSAFNLINDNRNAIRINALIDLVSFRTLGIHLLILNFLSLIGLNALFITFEKWFPSTPSFLIFIAVFLSPSILFWTSGFLKETHTLLFIGLFFMALNKLLTKPRLNSVLLFLVSLVLLILVRSFFAATIILASIFLFLSFFLKNVNKRFLFVTLLYIPILFLLLYATDSVKLISDKQYEFILVGEKANSFFSLTPINEVSDFILSIPTSIMNVFLQPQLFSFDSWLYVFPVFENIDVICLLILALIYRRKIDSRTVQFVIFLALIYLFNATLIGSTVPIQGAIARYKSISQPFLLMILISFLDWRKIKDQYFNRVEA